MWGSKGCSNFLSSALQVSTLFAKYEYGRVCYHPSQNTTSSSLSDFGWSTRYRNGGNGATESYVSRWRYEGLAQEVDNGF